MTTNHRFDQITVDSLRRRRSHKWTYYPNDVIPAFVAEMDFPLADPVRAVLRAAADNDDVGYAPRAASIGLPAAVATWCASSFGWAPQERDVLIIADVVRGLEIGVQAFAEPGAAVVVVEPVYGPFRSVPESHGRQRVDVALDSSGRLDLDAIDAALRAGARAVLLCHPHNPNGVVWTDAELDGLVEVVRRYDAWIVSDEIWAPLTYAPLRHVPLASRSAAAAERALTLTSTSKSWNTAGLKAAAMVCGSDAVRARVMALPPHTRGGIGVLGELTMLAAMRDGQPWIDEVRAYLDDSRRWLVTALTDALPGVRYNMPEATYLAWLDCRTLELGPSAADFFLEHARVALSPGTDFGDAEHGYGGFARLNFATSRPVLTEILTRMADAVAGMRRP